MSHWKEYFPITAFRLIPVVAIALALAIPLAARAQNMGPDPAMSPAQVVAEQLNALMTNDDPVPDAGIARTFALAHPMNRRLTGPLERFTALLKGPSYRPLLGHSSHEIQEIESSDSQVAFRVFVQTPDGEVVEYYWQVNRAAEEAGAWMTTVVSPPRPAGQMT